MAYGDEWKSLSTAQEVFDFVLAHLIEQGGPALRGTKCVLRSETGLACAMGCLVPDRLYRHEMDSEISGPVSMTVFLGSQKNQCLYDESERAEIAQLRVFFCEHVSVITALQNLHDTNDVSISIMISRLQTYTRRLNLTLSEAQIAGIRTFWKRGS